MSSTQWVVFNLMLFFVVGLLFICVGILYKCKTETRMKPPWTWWFVFGIACVVWATGWLFQLYGYGVLENVFKAVGGLLFLANGVRAFMFLIRRNQPCPPAEPKR